MAHRGVGLEGGINADEGEELMQQPLWLPFEVVEEQNKELVGVETGLIMFELSVIEALVEVAIAHKRPFFG